VLGSLFVGRQVVDVIAVAVQTQHGFLLSRFVSNQPIERHSAPSLLLSISLVLSLDPGAEGPILIEQVVKAIILFDDHREGALT
jgi:hypothetical protein